MKRKLKSIILTIALIFLGFQTYAQMAQQGPPEPTAQQNNNRKVPCADLPGNNNPGNGQGPNIPPPPGLCLPINDYLLPLLFVGIALGGYKVWKIENAV